MMTNSITTTTTTSATTRTKSPSPPQQHQQQAPLNQEQPQQHICSTSPQTIIKFEDTLPNQIETILQQTCLPLQKNNNNIDNENKQNVAASTNELIVAPVDKSPMETCDLNPEFAVICTFIGQFGDKIGAELNIQELKDSLEDNSKLHENLLELHIKLLKKIRRYFVRDQWEKALIRFSAEYSYDVSCEIEQLGYQNSKTSTKIELLRRLLEAQFECDQKFRAAINLCEADDLRLNPLGRDIKGNIYWFRSDNNGNIRVFREDPLNYKSWSTICDNEVKLKDLIDELELIKDDKVIGEPMLEPYHYLPEIFPEYFIKEDKDGGEKTPTDQPDANQSPENQGSESKKNIKGKRGKRGKQNGETNNVLQVVKEEENEAYHEDDCNDRSIIRIKTEVLPQCDEKMLPDKPSVDINECLPNKNDDDAISLEESQVKLTLEGIINKVIFSIGSFIKPLYTSPEHTNAVEKKHVSQKPAPKKRVPKKERFKEETLPRRTSSRIQQIQQKKQEEEIKKLFEEPAKPHVQLKKSVSESDDDDTRNSENLSKSRKRRRREKSWARGKNKKKLSWDQDDSDLSSISSLTDESELDFSVANESANLDNEDEFACEDNTNIEPVITKRARTAKTANLDTSIDSSMNESFMTDEDKPCGRCRKSNDPEWILLCDMCDDGYHTSCCIPPLMIVPDGDWFCPPCEHKMLLTKLQDQYAVLKQKLEEKERERMKKQRYRQPVTKKKSELKPPSPLKQEIKEVEKKLETNIYDDEILGLSSSSDSEQNATSDESFKADSATDIEEDLEDEEELDEELEEDEDTEEGSFVTSDSSLDEIILRPSKKSRYRNDDAFESRTRRRAATLRVSYKESTDEDDINAKDDDTDTDLDESAFTNNITAPDEILEAYVNETKKEAAANVNEADADEVMEEEINKLEEVITKVEIETILKRPEAGAQNMEVSFYPEDDPILNDLE